MERDQLKFQKTLKGIGVLNIFGGVLSIVFIFFDISKINSGEYVLYAPLWQLLLPTVVLIALQFLLSIFALCFAKNEKVKYCMYAGIVFLVCTAIDMFFLNPVKGFDLSTLSRLMFPALYTAIAFNLKTSYKNSNQ